jgi:hypothetical protein
MNAADIALLERDVRDLRESLLSASAEFLKMAERNEGRLRALSDALVRAQGAMRVAS